MEGSHSNVFAVAKGELITPPLSNYILGGITRQVVLELCRKLGIPHRDGIILSSEIPGMEEIMIAGTTVEVTPVRKILNVNFQTGIQVPLPADSSQPSGRGSARGRPAFRYNTRIDIYS